ncbi:MAG: hypothetical protein IT431_05965 [Phycisphaerales bacterium]|nr:hypothetical protein [Phycisphaerales bacterium]
MGYALMHGAALLAMVAPVVAWLWVRAARAGWFARPAERVLFALVAAPLVPLVEVLALSLLPVERPLRLALPWVHLAVATACAASLLGARRWLAPAAGAGVRRARRVWAALDGATRIAVVVASAAVLLALLHGAWNTGDEHDGALYRMLVAVQPFQDGRVGWVTFPLDDFADAYPRTIELLYSWTMLCTGTTVGFHLVNWYFLLVLAAAAYVLARRARLRHRLAVLCAALTATTPMPIYLTGVLYNDLPVCALLAAGVAFCAPRRRGAWGRSDLAGFALAVALGASAKFSVAIGAGVLSAVVLGGLVVGGPRVRGRGWRGGVGSVPTVLAIAGAAMVAATPYVRSWVLYGSPLWPLRVEVGPWTVFDGPMAPEQLWITARGPWLERWGAAVYKLFQTTSQDANGAFGLLFAVGVVPAAVVFAAKTVRRPSALRVLLVCMFWYVALVPVSTNLRYSLHILPAGYVMLCALLPGRRSVGRGRVVTPVLLVMLAVNSADYARTVVREVGEQLRWGASLTDPVRNRLWYMRFMYVKPGVAPETHGAVHGLVRPGERLVYSVQALGGLLYDPFFTYAIEYRSVEYYARHNGIAVDEAAGAWLSSLLDDDIDAVLVYAGSAEDRALGGAGTSFGLAYDQPDEPASRRARVYRRTGGVGDALLGVGKE